MNTRLYLLLLVLGLLQLPLQADTVTVTFTGTVTHAGALGSGSGISVGTISSIDFQSVSEPKTWRRLSLSVLGTAIFLSTGKTRWFRS